MTSDSGNDREWLSPKDLADRFGVSRKHVLDLVHSGLLPGSVRLSTRVYRIPRAAVDAFLRARAAGAQPMTAPG